MKTRTLKKDKVNVITLGCSKNLVDSENIITQLRSADIDVQHESNEDANIIVVNTCGFIDLAKEESINTILEYADIKKEGGIDKLFVTGCLSQRYKDDLEQEIPEVDAFFGTMELPALLAKFNVSYQHELIGERHITTLSHFAYLKISEGCNRTCSFCAIPLMRGGHVSRTIEDLVLESKNLVKQGVKEIILIAQELTYYGLDIYKERALSKLLDALCEVEGIEWIRLHYAYPSKFPLDIIETMVRQPKVCNYLDIPLQHAADNILSAMKRQITQAETRALIHDMRRINPEIAIRTTFLVGFPGETAEDFQQLLDFVADMKFERVGVFKYSHEEGTSAYDIIDDLSDEIKTERAQKLMALQHTISQEKNESLIGKQLRVLVDKKEGGYYVARSEYDSPEVDNEILIEAKGVYLREGDFVTVHIDDSSDYDLFATVVK